MSNLKQAKSALISVFSKDGLAPIVEKLNDLGITIYSTGGTEKFIKDNSGEYKIYQLWKNLPKKVMYQTYKIIIAYLLDINKIAVDSEGKIGYIWAPNYKRVKNLRWV